MILYLTGSPTRFGEDHFTEDNGFLSSVKASLRAVVGPGRKPRVLLVSAAPDDKGFTDSVEKGMSLCIRRSGIKTERIVMLDRPNAANAPNLVSWADWVILCGGHVPTQNRFIHEIGLKKLLEGFDGVVMGCSAGSMNCADLVYSHPEMPGEAIDPTYNRWLKGLGLTDIQLIPHFEQVRWATVDGLRLFEDIAFPDSWGHRFYTFRDGGYVKVENGRSTLYGEAYEITRGAMRRVSEENKTYSFMNLIFISPISRTLTGTSAPGQRQTASMSLQLPTPPMKTSPGSSGRTLRTITVCRTLKTTLKCTVPWPGSPTSTVR